MGCGVARDGLPGASTTELASQNLFHRGNWGNDRCPSSIGSEKLADGYSSSFFLSAHFCRTNLTPRTRCLAVPGPTANSCTLPKRVEVPPAKLTVAYPPDLGRNWEHPVGTEALPQWRHRRSCLTRNEPSKGKIPMTNQIGELNPPTRLMMTPGPCSIDPRVYRALAAPIVGHLDPWMKGCMEEV